MKEKRTDAYDENILFNLRSLLTEKYGSNIRNKLAHGLLTDESANSSIEGYVWCFCLHICCLNSN
ncbi:DUF4209 domain-containing protein [Bacillus sp. A301a_S52]|jgi:hypothetical protein|nr:DUF4209 domain-containing protein [Bacillus sp. A301a_S52]UJW56612.1 DUF4209 domain-containing protein [Bacillus sp. A116_S68]